MKEHYTSKQTDMKTRGEHLPTEVWIAVLSYLEIHDLLRAFNDLNQYFNGILASNHLSFNMALKENNNDDTQNANSLHLSKTILNRIICLQSSVNNSYENFLRSHQTELTRLRSLIIKADTKEIPWVCSALRQLNTIRYLSLTCIPNQKLLEVILTTPSLVQCRLHFWRVISPIDCHCRPNNNIEILSIKLQDSENHSVISLLLSHMSKLRKLDISEENFVNKKSHPLFNEQAVLPSHVDVLNMTWGYHDIRLSNCLPHLFTVMPTLKYLYITLYYYDFNPLLFDNLIDHLWLIIEEQRLIKISIICHRLKKTVEKDLQTIFNDYCQQILRKISSRSKRHLEIKWFQEDLKRHRIEMT